MDFNPINNLELDKSVLPTLTTGSKMRWHPRINDWLKDRVNVLDPWRMMHPRGHEFTCSSKAFKPHIYCTFLFNYHLHFFYN
ncbi:hypothetical protein FKM82_016001 [Ascaphus truei]